MKDFFTSMKWLDFINERTGLVTSLRARLDEPLPTGPRWRSALFCAICFTILIDLFTGLLLMTVYSPSVTTAWSSVWYIQTQVTLGWLVRGVHHFGSDALIILLPIYLLQLLIARAYRQPREIAWWLLIGALVVVLALSITGFLLPWDQNGYWASQVRVNIVGLTPLIGDWLKKVMIGGTEFGHLTLTRFYTMHGWVLPGALVLMIAGYRGQVKRHKPEPEPLDIDAPLRTYWPDQVYRNSIACAVVFGGIVAASCYAQFALSDPLLAAPADLTSSDYPARPEWNFLFLYQWLKLFEGPSMETAAAIGAPAVILLFFAVLPLVERIIWPGVTYGFALLVTTGLIGGMGYLTYDAIREDVNPPDALIAEIQAKQTGGDTLTKDELAALRARQFNLMRTQAQRVRRRTFELVEENGIPPSGPLELLYADPQLRGPILFAQHCASCHRIDGHDGRGIVPTEPATSSDLAGFATRDWIRGLLADPMSEKYFGLMIREDGREAHTRMNRWVEKTVGEFEDREDVLEAQFDAVAAYLQDEAINPGRFSENLDEDWEAFAAAEPSPQEDPTERVLLQGRRFFTAMCNDCHRYEGERKGSVRAPEMLGYGSVAWLEMLIGDAGHDMLFRKVGSSRALMPEFEDRISPAEINLLARWLRESRSGSSPAN